MHSTALMLAGVAAIHPCRIDAQQKQIPTVAGPAWNSGSRVDSMPTGMRMRAAPPDELRPTNVAGAAVATAVGVSASPLVDAWEANPPDGMQVLETCLAVPLGAGVTARCGTAEYVLPLPAITVRDQTVTPALVYSSRQASGTSVLRVTLRRPPTGLPVTMVRMRLWHAGIPVTGVLERATPSWAVDEPRIVAIHFDASWLPRGRSQVAIVTEFVREDGSHERVTTLDVRIPAVERISSRFGTGWTLAGLDRILTENDGSLTLETSVGPVFAYKPVGSDVRGQLFVRAPLARPDTLIRTAAGYLRPMPGLAVDSFDLEGRLLLRRDVTGAATTYEYDGCSRVVALRFAQSHAPYSFAYQSGCGGTLTHVDAPPLGMQQRRTTLSRTPWGFYSIDAGGNGTILDVDGKNWITAIRDVRNVVSLLYYDCGGLLYAVRTNVEAPSPEHVVRSMNNVDGRRACSPQATTDHRTFAFSPRGDSIATVFELDRMGSPYRVTDATGRVQTTDRADPRFPLLPTRTVSTTGRQTWVAYNARGLVDSVVSVRPFGDHDGRDAVVRMGWHPVFDRPLWQQGAEGELSHARYDAVGNLVAAWRGPLADSLARATILVYRPSGSPCAHLPLSARSPMVSVADTIHRDAACNTVSYRSSTGALSTVTRDALGRVTALRAPIEAGRVAVDSVMYDVLDRPIWTRSWGDGVTYTAGGQGWVVPADTLTTITHFDAAGLADTVRRIARPRDPRAVAGRPGTLGPEMMTTAYRYDAHQRLVEEHHLGLTWRRWAFDPAGNVMASYDPMGLVDTSAYDRLDRVIRRIVAPRHHGALDCATLYASEPGLCSNAMTTFGSTVSFAARLVPGDTLRFAYDALTGGLSEADNRSARIRRRYFANGALATDSLWIRRLVRSDSVPFWSWCREGCAERPAPPPPPACQPFVDPNCEIPMRSATQGTGVLAAGAAGTTMPMHGSDPEFGLHAYGFAYAYDRSGRPTHRWHPTTLLACGPSCAPERWHYGSVTALLDSLSDPLGLVHRWAYDAAGRPIERRRAVGGVLVDQWAYDPNTGRLVGTRAWRGSDSLVVERYSHDAMDRIARVASWSSWQRRTDSADVTRSGLGAVVHLGQRVKADTALVRTLHEHLRQDAHGNRLQVLRQGSRPEVPVVREGYTDHRYSVVGQLVGTVTEPFAAGTAGQVRDTIRYRPDGGTAVALTAIPQQQHPWTGALMTARSQRREYADALGRPFWVQVHGGLAGPSDNRWEQERGLLEEHRYDALGRQVLVWQRRELLPTPGDGAPPGFTSGSCIYENCESAVVRTVWAGDQALYEIRTSANDSTAHLDHVAETDRPPTDVPGERGSLSPWGLVLHVYGDDLDMPLMVARGWDATVAGSPQRILFPHDGWRGMAVGGTMADGQAAWMVPWIGRNATLDHEFTGVPGVGTWRWAGTRLADGKEASGLLNRRNRFYDPRTARFTSVDPIGLAGGANVYGFVGGDPLSWSDPDGLKPKPRLLDVAVGFVPGVSTVDDLVVVALGRSLTGTQLGGIDRLASAIGLVTPASGGEIRAARHMIYELVDRSGVAKYVGRTMHEIARASAHGRNSRFAGLDFRVRLRDLSEPQAKILEQLRIEARGGAARGLHGGLLNINNGIGSHLWQSTTKAIGEYFQKGH